MGRLKNPSGICNAKDGCQLQNNELLKDIIDITIIVAFSPRILTIFFIFNYCHHNLK
jgi:hypothetical protein